VATGSFTYDTDNRLTGLAYTANGGQSSIDTFGWAYNAGSLVTSFTSNDGTASYSYDPTNQLTSATYTTNSGGHQPANESYSFDSNGNRNMTGYSTGSDNLTSSDGTYNYGYDADGNLVSRTQIASTYSTDYRTTYTWDYRNRLTDVENFDNNGVLTQHVHYVYDVFDHLIATEVDTTGDGTYNVIQRYVVEGGQPVLEFDNNDNLIQRNLVAPDPAGVDAVMAQETTSTGAVTWMLDDNEGTPRDIVNNSSQVVNHMVYSAFGLDVYESNSSYVHWNGFAGSHDDTYTGLDENGLRWDNPATGKWLSQDPIDFLGGDANLSRYSGNSPTNGMDPSGLASVTYNTSVTAATFNNAQIVSAIITTSTGQTYYGGETHFSPATAYTITGLTGTSMTVTVTSGIIGGVDSVSGATVTTVYSLLLENNPGLSAAAQQAEEEIKDLALDAMIFYASTPFLATPIIQKELMTQTRTVKRMGDFVKTHPEDTAAFSLYQKMLADLRALWEKYYLKNNIKCSFFGDYDL
jgi:RHS repeat-associated protein